jgi:hypothetical protein
MQLPSRGQRSINERLRRWEIADAALESAVRTPAVSFATISFTMGYIACIPSHIFQANLSRLS